MKKSGLFIALLLVFAVVACKKVKPKKVDKTMTSGSWVVTIFTEGSLNETAHFAGYVFTFSDDGSVSAVNGSSTINGSWSTEKGTSSDDNNTVFVLEFPDTNNFDELSDDWHVLSLEDNKLELQDVSGGDSSMDYLVFEKQ